MKRLILLMIIVSMCTVMAFAQQREMTVEESYLQESIENMIIREQSRVNNRDQKFLALELISAAIERGNRSEEIHVTLEYLGLEGILNRSQESGRLINNFPDVRRETARQLGILGTPEARDILLTLIYYENEPMVLQEAVKSLGDIGIDDNGRTISTIAWIFHKFHNTVPDNLLAFATIEAIEKLAGSGIRNPAAVELLVRIADGPYIPVVRNRAMAVLETFRSGS